MNMTIEIIETELKVGQVSPHRLVEFSDWLSAHSSSIMDRTEELIQASIAYFNEHRSEFKSDKATEASFSATTMGTELRIAETTQKRITMLLRAIGRHLKVAELEAYNRI